MKNLYFVLVVFSSITISAQVGINTETPRALLEIKAANEIADTAGVMVTEDGLLIPRVTTLLANTDQPIEGLLIYLMATYEDPSTDPSTVYEPGFYVSYGSEWKTFENGSGESLGQLRLVDEGNTNPGYRLVLSDPAKYGNIGSLATDLSHQENVSTTAGATGEISFAANLNNTASGDLSAAFGFQTNAGGSTSVTFGNNTAAKANSSMALGTFNTDYMLGSNGTDRLLIVGNGDSDISRSDALIVLKNGVVTAPSMDNAEINAAGNEVLVTKGYLDDFIDNDAFTGIEQVVEGGNTGLRRSDADSANYGNIGASALDLSVSLASSTTRGATGDLSLALGAGTTASGRGATTMGRRTEASGRFSTAIGELSTASGDASAAIGLGLLSQSNGEVALGTYNTDYTIANDNTDRVLSIGNGTSDTTRSDALIVQKNGLVTSPSLSLTELQNAGNKALITKEYFDANNTGGNAGLEEITEDGNTGYRRVDAIANNHGDIGSFAVDLSSSDVLSATFGATGGDSFATGFRTTASGPGSTALGASTTASGINSTSLNVGTTASGTGSIAMGVGTTAIGNISTAIGHNTTARSINEIAMGSFNTDYTLSNNDTDRLLVIGNGSSGSNSDALIIQKNGTITAPSLDSAEITAAGNKALITKEYFDANNTAGTAGLEEITEGSNTGYRRADADPVNYGNIGSFAVDLSYSDSASSTQGATGNFASFAAGSETTASGNFSAAIGARTTASGAGSTAMGSNSIASGGVSTAMGNNTTASGLFSTAMGDTSIASGDVSTALGSSTASGDYSTAMGIETLASGRGSNTMGIATIASNDSETALGKFNIEDIQNDNLFVVGNGTATNSRSDAFLVTENGAVSAPTFSTAEIDALGNTALITKEYFDANAVVENPGLEEITESGNTGYRRADAIADNHGDIGGFAVDLSSGIVLSTTRGATGGDSFATGFQTTASGDSSTAMGSGTTASSFAATAIGRATTASAISSTAIGSNTIAANEAETALGKYNIVDIQGDNLFVVGNGNSVIRSDAFLVTENGAVSAPTFSTEEIDALGNTALVTKQYADANYAAAVPSGNTASRPAAPPFGTIRYNTETGRPEIYVENSTDLPTDSSGATYIPGWIRL
ncbi:MAG: hypothetical protein WBG46_09080 [Nonlabens sp.]